jgi:hypothetical protein
MSVPDSFPSTDRGKHSEGSGSKRQNGSFQQRHQSKAKASDVPKTASEQRAAH